MEKKTGKDSFQQDAVNRVAEIGFGVPEQPQPRAEAGARGDAPIFGGRATFQSYLPTGWETEHQHEIGHHIPEMSFADIAKNGDQSAFLKPTKTENQDEIGDYIPEMSFEAIAKNGEWRS